MFGLTHIVVLHNFVCFFIKDPHPNPRRNLRGKFPLHHMPVTSDLAMRYSSCIHHPRDKFGCFMSKQVNIYSSWEWGYFCGLVIGDRYIVKNRRSRNYDICVKSTKLELINAFRRSADELGLNPNSFRAFEVTRKLPNGRVCTSIHYFIKVGSKTIYELLRPCKLQDYRFKVPEFIKQSEEAICGFLCGYFDAEGSAVVCSTCPVSTIQATSKHKENLLQIAELLKFLEIKSRITKSTNSCWMLQIRDNASKIKFAELAGFRLERKRKSLARVLASIKRINFMLNGKVVAWQSVSKRASHENTLRE